MRVLCAVRYWHVVGCGPEIGYARTRDEGVMTDTSFPYWVSSHIPLCARYAQSGTDLGYAPTLVPADKRVTPAKFLVQTATGLRACYAMSGTDLAHGGYLPTRSCMCYAMCGTDLANGAVYAMRCAVLT
eukprot:1110454-Rhodomonas_salina.1